MVFTTIGIGLLLIVFYLAFEMLTHPVPGLKQALVPTSTAPGGSVNSVATVGGSVISFVLKLAVLFVMTLAGSHVAARGIQLYHGGVQRGAVVHVAPTAIQGSSTGQASTGLSADSNPGPAGLKEDSGPVNSAGS